VTPAESPPVARGRRRRAARAVLALLLAFLGVTAIAGAIALFAGVAAPPTELLAGSPFRDYTVPAAALGLVGICALAALIMVWRRHTYGSLLAGLVGVMIIIFEIVEVWAIGSDAGPAAMLQAVYLTTGLCLVGLALLVRR
jgi:hypothetical protein